MSQNMSLFLVTLWTVRTEPVMKVAGSGSTGVVTQNLVVAEVDVVLPHSHFHVLKVCTIDGGPADLEPDGGDT